ncbi:MAG TPA: cobalt ECF transporter T component CbiQ [Actinopolymorphaceae bacterium]
MGAVHAHRLYVHGHSVVHRLPAECKLVALVGFVFTVVATPRTAFAGFGCYAVLLFALIKLAQIPAGFALRRVVVEAPVVVFAVLLPFVAHGPQTEVLGVGVSEPGLLAAWNILAKATLGVLAAIVFAATTEQRDFLVGLQRLRVPSLLIQIVAFMVRYLDVITDQLGRMRVARESRGFTPKGVRAWPALAKSGGALFLRSYERGERVHLAMLSRGYNGTMPVLSARSASLTDWTCALLLPGLAVLVALGGWLL